MIDRRTLLTAAAASSLSAVARAASPPDRVFATPMFGGRLAGNPLAQLFSAPTPALRPPQDVILMGSDGPRRWSDLKGKVHLAPLWAEWCAPCLGEARDFATLLARRGGDSFGIVSMMTASHQKLDYQKARAALGHAQAADLPLWIEPDGGDRLYKTLAVWPVIGGPTLPCTLLLDRDGRIRGRAFGAPTIGAVSPTPGARAITTERKAELAAGEIRSAWSTPAADAFVQALIAGALD